MDNEEDPNRPRHLLPVRIIVSLVFCVLSLFMAVGVTVAGVLLWKALIWSFSL